MAWSHEGGSTASLAIGAVTTQKGNPIGPLSFPYDVSSIQCTNSPATGNLVYRQTKIDRILDSAETIDLGVVFTVHKKMRLFSKTGTHIGCHVSGIFG